jgi:uncharacterized protein HemY
MRGEERRHIYLSKEFTLLRLMIFLLFLTASVWFGVAVIRHPGYLLISYEPWLIQMPLWFALLCLLFLLGLFYVFIDGIDRLHFTWFRLKNWWRFRYVRKAKLISKEQVVQFQKSTYCTRFQQLTPKTDQGIQTLWKAVPRSMRYDGAIVAAYVAQNLQVVDSKGVLLLTTHPTRAFELEKLIRKVLRRTWYPELVPLYGQLQVKSNKQQLAIVGGWLKIYGPHQSLFLLLGQLCVQLQLWGKAKDYFKKCLEMGACPDASLAYGNLLEQLGDTQAAIAIYSRHHKK